MGSAIMKLFCHTGQIDFLAVMLINIIDNLFDIADGFAAAVVWL